MSIEKQHINGSCLCGSVSITINPPDQVFDACHCGMCRKWGSGPVFTVEGGDHPVIKGEDSISIYSSSEWAERGFCKQCGTHLFYRLKNENFCNFSAGLFKEVEKFKFHVQIYIDSKPACYEFANKTEMMTEAEVIAKFSGK
jgi:hypothetical protein